MGVSLGYHRRWCHLRGLDFCEYRTFLWGRSRSPRSICDAFIVLGDTNYVVSPFLLGLPQGRQTQRRRPRMDRFGFGGTACICFNVLRDVHRTADHLEGLEHLRKSIRMSLQWTMEDMRMFCLSSWVGRHRGVSDFSWQFFILSFLCTASVEAFKKEVAMDAVFRRWCARVCRNDDGSANYRDTATPTTAPSVIVHVLP